MRKPKEHRAADGTTTYRVRYRSGGKETSQTFRRPGDAQTFAAILGDGKPDRVAEALRWLAAQDDERSAATFAEWFDTYVDQLTGITPRTRSDYHAIKRRYLYSLDGVPLPLLTRSHVTDIVNRMDRDGLSRKTIKHSIHLLSSCLALAVDDGHIPSNPCRRIRLPADKITAVEARFLTQEEAGALLACVDEHYVPLVTVLFGTGMRWSEATALFGRHVNLDAGTMRVDQAWKRVPGKGYELGPPKTAKSRRTVNPAVAALAAVQPLIRRPSDLLFLTTTGRPVQHANFRHRVWVPACERAGLDPSPRIHDARHSHASWLISDGKSLEQVQDQLGHESILTTRGVYGHLQPALGAAVGVSASAAMDNVLAQARHLSVVRSLEPGGHAD